MPSDHLVVPEQEIDGIGNNPCPISEVRGYHLRVHECRSGNGLFYWIESEGIVRFDAPEFEIHCGQFTLRVDQSSCRITSPGSEIIVHEDCIIASIGSSLAELKPEAAKLQSGETSIEISPGRVDFSVTPSAIYMAGAPLSEIFATAATAASGGGA